MKDSTYFKIGVAAILLLVLAAVGYCMNVYKIFQISIPVSEFGIMEIARCVGALIAPIGAVLGWF